MTMQEHTSTTARRRTFSRPSYDMQEQIVRFLAEVVEHVGPSKDGKITICRYKDEWTDPLVAAHLGQPLASVKRLRTLKHGHIHDRTEAPAPKPVIQAVVPPLDEEARAGLAKLFGHGDLEQRVSDLEAQFAAMQAEWFKAVGRQLKGD